MKYLPVQCAVGYPMLITNVNLSFPLIDVPFIQTENASLYAKAFERHIKASSVPEAVIHRSSALLANIELQMLHMALCSKGIFQVWASRYCIKDGYWLNRASSELEEYVAGQPEVAVLGTVAELRERLAALAQIHPN